MLCNRFYPDILDVGRCEGRLFHKLGDSSANSRMRETPYTAFIGDLGGPVVGGGSSRERFKPDKLQNFSVGLRAKECVVRSHTLTTNRNFQRETYHICIHTYQTLWFFFSVGNNGGLK